MTYLSCGDSISSGCLINPPLFAPSCAARPAPPFLGFSCAVAIAALSTNAWLPHYRSTRGTGPLRSLLTSLPGCYTPLGPAPSSRSITGQAPSGPSRPTHPPCPFTASLHRHRWRAVAPWGSVSKVHLAVVFPFSRSKIRFASPCHPIAARSSTLQRMMLSLRPTRLQHRNLWPCHHQCRHLFRRWCYPCYWSASSR